MRMETDCFQTRDLWLAAALMAAGCKLQNLTWFNGRAFFIFQNKDRCEELAQAYWAGDLQVKAKSFTDGLRTLKDRLHETGDDYGYAQRKSS